MLSGEKRYKRKGVAEGRGIRECGLHLVGQEETQDAETSGKISRDPSRFPNAG